MSVNFIHTGCQLILSTLDISSTIIILDIRISPKCQCCHFQIIISKRETGFFLIKLVFKYLRFHFNTSPLLHPTDLGLGTLLLLHSTGVVLGTLLLLHSIGVGLGTLLLLHSTGVGLGTLLLLHSTGIGLGTLPLFHPTGVGLGT